MVVTTSGGAHVCYAAEQHTDGVYLIDDSGKVKLIITKPSDIKEVQGGEITIIDKLPPTDNDRIAQLEAQLAAYEAAYAEGVNEA